MNRVISFHPLILASFPVLFLAAQNVDEVTALPVLSALVVAIGGTALVMLLLWLLVRDMTKMSVTVSVLLLVFFSFGHIRDALQGTTVAGVVINQHRVLLPVAGVVAISAICSILRYRGNLVPVVHVTAMLASLLVIFNLSVMTLYTLQSSIPVTDVGLIGSESKTPGSRFGELPDIYYIILDGYGRADVLNQTHDFNNSDFIEFLTESGFYVADKSQSNYVRSIVSLASSLNMRYLNEYMDAPPNKKREHAQSLILNNEVVRTAKRIGYKFVLIPGSRMPEQMESVDIRIRPQSNSRWNQLYLNDFSATLVRSTLAGFYLQRFFVASKADLFIDNMSKLREVAQIPEPTLALLHNIPPHPPYIFNRNIFNRNGDVRRESEYQLDQGWELTEQYVDQLIYVNKVVMETVEDILENSAADPIIIIQADHGPSSRGDHKDPKDLDDFLKWERSGILSAYHVPERCRPDLYSSMSPVNTFRLVFGKCLELGLDLLEDQTCLSLRPNLYDFFPVGPLAQPQ